MTGRPALVAPLPGLWSSVRPSGLCANYRFIDGQQHLASVRSFQLVGWNGILARLFLLPDSLNLLERGVD